MKKNGKTHLLTSHCVHATRKKHYHFMCVMIANQLVTIDAITTFKYVTLARRVLPTMNIQNHPPV